MTYAFGFGEWSAPPSFIIWEYDPGFLGYVQTLKFKSLKQKHLDFLDILRKSQQRLVNSSKWESKWPQIGFGKNTPPNRNRLAKQKMKWEDSNTN